MAITMKTPEATETDVVIVEKGQQQETPAPKQTIVCWFHDTDIDLLRALEPHLQVLAQQFDLDLCFFGYNASPIGPTKEEKAYTDSLGLSIKERKEKELQKYVDKYNNTIEALNRAAIFLPAISPQFVMRFWSNIRQDSRLSKLMADHSWPIHPIAIHPIARFNLAKKGQIRPLVAYEGYERESASAALAARIERKLKKSKHQQATKDLQPLFFKAGKRRWLWV